MVLDSSDLLTRFAAPLSDSAGSTSGVDWQTLSSLAVAQFWLRIDTTMDNSWKDYQSDGFFDESITPKGNPRLAASRAINFEFVWPRARRAAASKAGHKRNGHFVYRLF